MERKRAQKTGQNIVFNIPEAAAEERLLERSRLHRVVIYYRFVGYLEIPDEATRFSEDTRQGATVTYISCAPIKVRYGDDDDETEEGE